MSQFDKELSDILESASSHISGKLGQWMIQGSNTPQEQRAKKIYGEVGSLVRQALEKLAKADDVGQS